MFTSRFSTRCDLFLPEFKFFCFYCIPEQEISMVRTYWNGHVWQTALVQDRMGIVGHGADHIQVTWGRGRQVTA